MITTSSPGESSAWNRLYSECLAPADTSTCSGVKDMALSFFSLSQMAARSSGMPAVAVYLVNPCLIASTAAALTWSGVSKSGSPAANPTTSTPAAASALALALRVSVGDGFTDWTRSASFRAMPRELPQQGLCLQAQHPADSPKRAVIFASTLGGTRPFTLPPYM